MKANQHISNQQKVINNFAYSLQPTAYNAQIPLRELRTAEQGY